MTAGGVGNPACVRPLRGRSPEAKARAKAERAARREAEQKRERDDDAAALSALLAELKLDKYLASLQGREITTLTELRLLDDGALTSLDMPKGPTVRLRHKLASLGPVEARRAQHESRSPPPPPCPPPSFVDVLLLLLALR